MAGPEALSWGQLAEIFFALLDVRVRYPAISDDEAQQALLTEHPQTFQTV